MEKTTILEQGISFKAISENYKTIGEIKKLFEEVKK